MIKVFVSGPIFQGAFDALRERFDVVEGANIDDCPNDVEAVLTLVTDRIDEALLDRLPRLRIVANVAVGVDNIDKDACRKRGVVVTNTPDVLTEATADMAFGLLIAAARRIAEGDRYVRAGQFTKWSPSLLLGVPVHGMKLGIVGFGRIGKAVARRARGFGMHVGYAQHHREPEPIERALGATHLPLEELFASSDAVSIHCPLTPDTRHLVTRELLAKMPRGSIFVNTARGPIVDEAALADALANGPLAAAGLDVYENEPRLHPKLLELPNVVLTPHIGSADAKTRAAMAMTAAKNVLRVLGGEPPLTPV